MEVEKIGVTADAHPMNGGDGQYSYTKNSYYQNIIEAVELKYQTEGLSSCILELQVFFNDHVSNDFNTLFASLPADRRYFMAGVPGSFYGRLFPEGSLDFVHSSYALQWLSKVPKEVTDKSSPAYNKGKVHYTSASKEVIEAYSTQFAKDMGTFLSARATELVSGGLMVLILPGLSNGIPHSKSTFGMLFDLLGSCLMDMAKIGLTDEAKVDSFNFPLYMASPQELEDLVERNGLFSIERLEQVINVTWNTGALTEQSCSVHLRASLEGIIKEHFGSENIDELFDRFSEKLGRSSYILNADYTKGTQLFIVLKRKMTD
uniref:S-adenosylmethionine-dependent methyltransferase At5g38100 n=1 Tax=Nelumbo nucifera TaxID=4432 RepID=A0A822YNP1_NELNU|nr:TPA_asm: hypothetical protein HUJ06_006443 [Nelumbo nucifera]